MTGKPRIGEMDNRLYRNLPSVQRNSVQINYFLYQIPDQTQLMLCLALVRQRDPLSSVQTKTPLFVVAAAVVDQTMMWFLCYQTGYLKCVQQGKLLSSINSNKVVIPGKRCEYILNLINSFTFWDFWKSPNMSLSPSPQVKLKHFFTLYCISKSGDNTLKKHFETIKVEIYKKNPVYIFLGASQNRTCTK